MKHLCVLGMFRSGTNFIRAAMELNYDCRIKYDVFGWKHGFYPILNKGSGIVYPDDEVIFITKNPFSSLHSLYKYSMTGQPNMISENKQSLKEFIRSPLNIRDGGNPNSVEYYFSSPVDFWNSMNWNLESVVSRRGRAIHIQYEKLLDGPERETAKIAAAFGLARKDGDFSVPETRMKNLGNNQHNPANFTQQVKFDADAVKELSYMSHYDQEDRKFVLDRVSAKLIEKLGYSSSLAEIL
ncbi:hypothetical protein M2360_002657 [Rhizobium sp. SG_E_25_P2]|jgi:hypothetical protein|uniref:hypothetical protein n=1 Tax=Rhizobium sp. SG_E_25_P2 TaxID=2879942 RepID=UPI0024738E64|nr:hypothetical protein [Rhizobium sp. SG_E_25_P2]MDH6267260.1 hypothetical protein [Rhizobium sp. SG_E_25_P2]